MFKTKEDYEYEKKIRCTVAVPVSCPDRGNLFYLRL
jgi:hypothetical protein